MYFNVSHAWWSYWDISFNINYYPACSSKFSALQCKFPELYTVHFGTVYVALTLKFPIGRPVASDPLRTAQEAARENLLLRKLPIRHRELIASTATSCWQYSSLYKFQSLAYLKQMIHVAYLPESKSRSSIQELDATTQIREEHLSWFSTLKRVHHNPLFLVHCVSNYVTILLIHPKP